MSSNDFSNKGRALTQLFAVSAPFNLALSKARDQLSVEKGITGARWQLLIAVAQAERPETVSNFSRILGISRQSIQRLADELEACGFIKYIENPHHKRAPLIFLTERATKDLTQLGKKYGPWINQLASEYSLKDINNAIELLASLRLKLEDELPS